MKLAQHKIVCNRYGSCKPLILILAPTRELALQTKEVFDQFALFTAACIYGGQSRYEQVQFCRKQRPEIVVGTPGRINDLLDSSIIEVDEVLYLGKYI